MLAPLLIDNLELEGKVFDAGIPQEMLSGLGKLDLVGVGVLPGPMRKVLGVRKPFTKPGRLHRAVVGIQDSGVADQTFQALGAHRQAGACRRQARRPRRLRPAARLDPGQPLRRRRQVRHREPQPVAAAAGDHRQPGRLRPADGRPARHPGGRRQGRRSGRHGGRTQPPTANAIAVLCKAGLTFAQSSDADLEAFEKALAPVYATIRKDPANAAWLDRITAIKKSLHRAPDSADCSNVPD